MNRNSDEKDRVASLLRALAVAPGPRAWSIPDGEISIAAAAPEGDDCAVIDLTGELSLVWGSDYVRGPKFTLFELGLLNYYDLGYYLVVANISDIAAMGAQPIGVLTIVRYPPELLDSEFDAVLSGAADAARRYGCDLLGGDTGGAERLILAASAVGACERGTALRRANAHPGDVLCLTGEIGSSAAAILHFSNKKPGGNSGVSADDEAQLLAAWRRPEACVAQGRMLAEGRLASACQDISDGLRVTVEELAAASDVRLVVDASSVPVSPAVRSVAEVREVDALALAMSASVDFELLFTVPRSRLDACRGAFRDGGLAIHEIGFVGEGKGAELRQTDGSSAELPGVGWRHQSEDVSQLFMAALKPDSENGS